MASSWVIRKSIGITALLIANSTAYADSPHAPFDYKVETTNSRYVFVMLAGYTRGHGAIKNGPNPEPSGENLRATYPASGMYRNDGSIVPLWTVDWYSFNVVPCSDGRHLVEFGPWPTSYTELALAFHALGRELKRYRIDELVQDTAILPHTVSHFSWLSGYYYDGEHSGFAGEIDLEKYL